MHYGDSRSEGSGKHYGEPTSKGVDKAVITR